MSRSQSRYPQRRLRRSLWWLTSATALAVSALMAGCQPRGQPTPTPQAVASPTASQSADPSNGGQQGSATSSATILRVWLPPDIASASVRDQGRLTLFVDLVAERAQLGDNASLSASTKALHGPGGLRESVLATAPVAPARLPHLAVIDTVDLPALVAAGLAQPIAIDALPGARQLSELATQAVTIDGTLYGVPLCADLLVLAYDADQVSAPPKTWTELLTGPDPLLFPAARGADAADMLLSHYVSEGGVLVEADPVLDTAALSRALAAYQVGKAAGAIHDEAVAIDSFELAWAAYLAGQTNLAATTSQQVLRDGANAPHTALAALPLSGARPTVLGRTLAWVVLTPDPDIQRLALALAEAALAPDLQGALAAQSYHLPILTEALDDAVAGPWREQLAGLYALAQPLPQIARYATLEAALGEAAESVIAGVASPTGAAGLAAARIAQSQ